MPGADGRTKSGRFAFARVRLAERRTKGRSPSEEVWIIVEHRDAKKGYRLHASNLPKGTKHAELVRLVKLRWRVERDYRELRGEIGLDHFEGGTWRGFRHHAALCAAALCFLALARRLSPHRTTCKWTLPFVRRPLQYPLLRRLGECPLCRQPFDPNTPPRGPSKM